MTVLMAYFLDLILADPPHWPHPVRWIGGFTAWLDQKLNLLQDSHGMKLVKGALVVFFVLTVSYGTAFWVIRSARSIHPWAAGVLSVYLAYTTISARGLKLAALEVLKPLEADDLPGARRALSMIVGRETSDLSEGEVVRGTVETVAENFSDGVIAPLFFLVLGGVPLAMAYKAANTMDSMLGYRNERYLYFGRAAARFDDVLNWIPARLSVIFLVAAAYLTGKKWKSSWSVALRDGRNHKSPNAGWPEAAVAGALSIQLGGTNTYFGCKVEKPTIGDPLTAIRADHILQSVKLLDIASFAAVLTGSLLMILLGGV